MIRILTYSTLAFAISFGIVPAHGSTVSYYTYEVNQFSLPCTPNSCTGNISLEGKIVTDNIGSLSANDIVVWDLVVSVGTEKPIELVPSNSGFSTFGSPQITGTTSDLFITLNTMQDGFAFTGASTAPAIWIYGGLSAGAQVLLFNTSDNQYSAQQPLTLPVTLTAGAVFSATETPEPASLFLVLSAGIMCLVARKKRPKAKLLFDF